MPDLTLLIVFILAIGMYKMLSKDDKNDKHDKR